MRRDDVPSIVMKALLCLAAAFRISPHSAGGPSLEIRDASDPARRSGITPKLARGPTHAAGCPTLCIVRVGGPVHVQPRDGQARENTRA
jgi:hypothetical protein